MSRDNEEKQVEHGSDAKQPLSYRELITIVLSGHLGVRKREQRVDDFSRAKGAHVFVAAVLYFALIVTGLILLVSYVTR